MSKKNLAMWSRVEKTNPKYTKPARLGGMTITSINATYQIKQATEQFGCYGRGFGLSLSPPVISSSGGDSSAVEFVVISTKSFTPSSVGRCVGVLVGGQVGSSGHIT